MGYLPIIDEDQATGKLKEVYDEIKETRKLKQVSPVMQAFSMKPELLETISQLTYQVTFGGSTLGRRWEEMLSVAVSTWNQCHY